MAGNTLSNNAVEQLRKVVREHNAAYKNNAPQRGIPGHVSELREAKLISEIPTEPEEHNKFRWKPYIQVGTEDSDWIVNEDSEAFECVDRLGLNVCEGESVILAWINGEWRPIVKFEMIWRLEDCHIEPEKPKKPDIYVRNDLEEYKDRIVLVEGTCYKVHPFSCDELPECLDPACVVIEKDYDDCSKCKSFWKLTECVEGEEEPEEIITNTDLSDYEDKVVKLSEHPEKCWEVSHYEEKDVDPVPVEVVGDYEECEECLCYRLYRCGRGNFITTPTNLLSIAQQAGIEGLNSPEDLATQKTAFRIDGDCWYVNEVLQCENPMQEVTVQAAYEDCEKCGCIKLARCEFPSQVIYATNGKNADEEEIDLWAYVGKVIRLDNGNCYTVTSPPANECDNVQEVTVLEAYDNCANCKVYTLHECGSGDPGTTITTYTDLVGLGYKVGDTFSVGEGEERVCYTIVNDSADYEGSVAVEPVQKYKYCEQCERYYRYRLVYDCEDEDCKEGGGGGGEGGGGGDDKITDEDLSHAVGQWIKVGGACRLVETADPEAEVSSGYDAPISYNGPYSNCTSCQNTTVYPYSHFYDLIYHENGYIVRHRWERIITGPGTEKHCDRGKEYICACEPPQCKKLRLCNSDPEKFIYTQDIEDETYAVDDVLKRQEDGLYYVFLGDEKVNCGYPIQSFTVEGSPLEACPDPPEDTCVKLVLCGTEEDPEPTYIIVPAADLTNPDDDPPTVHERHANEGGGRWKVVELGLSVCDEAEAFDEIAVHNSCEDEDPGDLVELQKCGTTNTMIVAAEAFAVAPVMGKVYKDHNGDCWEVISVDADGDDEEFVEQGSWGPEGNPCNDCANAVPDCLSCAPDWQQFLGQAGTAIWDFDGFMFAGGGGAFDGPRPLSYSGGVWRTSVNTGCGTVEVTMDCNSGNGWRMRVYVNGTLYESQQNVGSITVSMLAATEDPWNFNCPNDGDPSLTVSFNLAICNPE